MADAFTGEIRIFCFTYAPENWAFCNGGTVQAQQYQMLLAVIGNLYGGNGTTTIGLPDLRGCVPMSAGTGAGLTPRVIPTTVGDETVTLTADQTPSHDHTLVASTGTALSAGITLSSSPGTSSYISRLFPPAPSTSTVAAFSTAATPGTTLAAQALAPYAGAGGAHENRQPYLVLNFCICVYGDFPPRP